MSEPLVRMARISKSYGSVRALTDVSLEVREREIVGLLGDNGAGKSTLIKILSGAIPATSGDIFIRGRKVEIRGTTDAIANGIETIYQDSALVTQLSIARNLFLGREPVKGPAFLNRMDQETMNRVAGELLRRVGISKNLPPTTPIASLSGGERQSVAIARAMYFDSELIILDEPTNNLGVAETQGVLQFVRNARELGPFLYLHRPQHPSRLPGSGPDRGPPSRYRGRRRHRSEPHDDRGSGACHHRDARHLAAKVLRPAGRRRRAAPAAVRGAPRAGRGRSRRAGPPGPRPARRGRGWRGSASRSRVPGSSEVSGIALARAAWPVG